MTTAKHEDKDEKPVQQPGGSQQPKDARLGDMQSINEPEGSQVIPPQTVEAKQEPKPASKSKHDDDDDDDKHSGSKHKR